MKNSVKVLLLILCSIGAVAAILIFAKTQVAPPSGIEIVDQYPDNLAAACNEINNSGSIDENRQTYLKLKDKIERLRLEGKISNSLADEKHSSINEVYGNHLTQAGLGSFSSSKWDMNRINQLVGYIDELGQDKLSSGTSAVSSKFNSDAKTIHGVLKDYADALALSKRTGFSSVSDAQSKVTKANNYKMQPYLRNNTELVNALNALPGKIADNHYKYVAGQINRMENYRDMSRESFATLTQQAERVMNEYSNASYCSTARKIDELRRRGENLSSEAGRYYRDMERSKSDYYY